MGDIPLNGPKKKGRSAKPKGGRNLQKEVEVEHSRAEAAEARVSELESAPTLLVVLNQEELSAIVRQRQLMEAAVEDANIKLSTANDARAIAQMMNSAYSSTWLDLRKRHGLPEDIDVDWTSGEIFRKSPVTSPED